MIYKVSIKAGQCPKVISGGCDWRKPAKIGQFWTKLDFSKITTIIEPKFTKSIQYGHTETSIHLLKYNISWSSQALKLTYIFGRRDFRNDIHTNIL